jgi:hypothetical protein
MLALAGMDTPARAKKHALNFNSDYPDGVAEKAQ